MLRDQLLALKDATRAPVHPLTDLTTLPAVHLTVFSLRADLDVLLRQRAYHAFLVKAAGEDGCGGARDFLSTPLPQPVPASIDSLALEQLLYIQVHPACDSDDLATQAYSVFLAKLDAEIANLPVLSFHAEKSDEARAEDNSAVLVLRLSQVDLGPYISIRDLEVRLFLETADLEGGLVERLTIALASWAPAEKAELSVEDENNNDRKLDVESDPTAPSNASSPSTDPSPENSAATPTTSIPPPSPISEKVSDEPPKKRVQGSDEDQERGAVEQPWQYLGERSVHVTWHPGLYTRQFALLRAIAPRVIEDFLDPPFFTTEELALLSLATDPKTLPKLPFPPELVSQRYRHKWEERLALERIYQEREHINIDQTRLVLLTSDFPSLRLCARVLSKVVKARDMFTKAYDSVLQAKLYPRLRDKATSDPIERIVVRNTLFSTSNVSLIAVSPLSAADIGLGSARRYEAELKLIVKYEKEALKIAREKVEG
ncbi:hypothetical protein JCM10296v2_006747 [Rhodotorula toruloides]